MKPPICKLGKKERSANLPLLLLLHLLSEQPFRLRVRAFSAGLRVWISALLFLGISSGWGFGQTGAAALNCSSLNVPPPATQLCSRGLFGWDDTCLVHRLRESAYFAVSLTDASDQQLRDYVKKNETSIVALLSQIDYGENVTRFTCNQAWVPETNFVDAVEQAKSIRDFLAHLVDVLNVLRQSVAADIASESLDALSTILEGIEVYKLAARVVISQDVRVVLGDYFYYRHDSNLSKEGKRLTNTPVRGRRVCVEVAR